MTDTAEVDPEDAALDAEIAASEPAGVDAKDVDPDTLPPELPDPADVARVTAPDDPAVVAAFEQAAVNAVQAVAAAEIAVATQTALAADDTSKVTEEDVATARDILTRARRRLDVVVAAQGADLEALQQKTQSAIVATIREKQSQVDQWEGLRKTHQSFLDTPEAYGFVDFGGSPLIPAQQREHVAQLTAAIENNRAQIEVLRTQAKTVRRRQLAAEAEATIAGTA